MMNSNKTLDNNKKLVFDFDNNSLLGLSIGDSIQKIKKNINLESDELGYAIYTEGNLITSIFICFYAGYRQSNSFQGVCKKNNVKLDLCINTTLDEIISIFGEPTTHWNDGVDESCTYVNKKYEYEFTWDAENKPLRLYYLMIDLKK